MTVHEHDESPTPGPLAADAAVATPTRAARRAATRRRRRGLPVVPLLVTLLFVAGVGYAAVDVLIRGADLDLSPLVARGFLAAQAVAVLLVAVAALVGVLLADRRATRAAQNPTLDEALADLAAAQQAAQRAEQATAEVQQETETLRQALANEQARTEAAQTAVSTARAERDAARADLNRYLGERPPDEREIRERVSREITAAHQASLADLEAAHQRVVSGLHARLDDAQAAAQRAEEARTVAEAGVAAACEATRAEERTRMRITVQALVLAARDTLGEAAEPVVQFADRFVEAVDRLDGPKATPAMPIRAVASRAGTESTEDTPASPKRRSWRSKRKKDSEPS